jgi:hypothetical protein
VSLWLMVLPVGGLGWWMLGFPPGWGWLDDSINAGELRHAQVRRLLESNSGQDSSKPRSTQLSRLVA